MALLTASDRTLGVGCSAVVPLAGTSKVERCWKNVRDGLVSWGRHMDFATGRVEVTDVVEIVLTFFERWSRPALGCTGHVPTETAQHSHAQVVHGSPLIKELTLR